MQLETLLRLLDNDQLNVDDTLNETRDLLEDYLDRNQARPVASKIQLQSVVWPHEPARCESTQRCGHMAAAPSAMVKTPVC